MRECWGGALARSAEDTVLSADMFTLSAVVCRFEHLTERDMALTIVAKRRSQQPIPEIPPQGGDWVNEVLNEQF
jgi:hypothetical protein